MIWLLCIIRYFNNSIKCYSSPIFFFEFLFNFQATGTSLLFDIALSGEVDANDVTYHSPITPGRPIKPFSLKLPSLSLDGQTKSCELCMLFS